ncbi:Hypothetical protein YE4142 [Yersinia enterocolitica subsp. enterocolitica 8081]|uniref:SpoVT-AbrB domain-containing protein n=2 Tax=Yersinia enterocolitica TaxID=630 RepID=A1JT40_YERE8|nr:Hypothetical protein YE4142 [Yersinia enterocolitica subsp. enterocolitica 8081]
MQDRVVGGCQQSVIATFEITGCVAWPPSGLFFSSDATPDICLAYASVFNDTSIRSKNMRTVSIFKNGQNRAIRLPKDMNFDGVTELEILRDGDSIILRPIRPTWVSFMDEDKADDDFLAERQDVIEEGRFEL